MTAAEAEATVDVLGSSVRLVAASSGDVYRARTSVFENRATDAVPLRGVPDDELPEDLAITGEILQPWLMDASRAAGQLGRVHVPPDECVANSARRHLTNPPLNGTSDFSADDAAVARLAR